MTASRLQFETAVLEVYFKNRFQFTKANNQNVLMVGLKSQSGKVYKLSVILPVDYPCSMPEVFIVYPTGLKGYDGRLLKSLSHDMHTLECKKGSVQICHFNPSNWNPSQSLYKVVMKTKVWLEAYEGHLVNGRPINDFLRC